MKLHDLLRSFNPMTVDQLRETRGRLRFAGLDTDAIGADEVELVKEVVATVLRQSAGQVRTAALATHGCPRCGAAVQAIRLADGESAAYCGSCRVVDPK